MKLLLLYPQQAEKPKQRLSRLGAQLADLSQSVRSVLDRSVGTQIKVSEFAYEQGNSNVAVNANSDRNSLRSVFDETDLILDISSEPGVNVGQTDYAGPIVHLSPAFGGSFACNDITIQGRGRLMQSEVVTCISDSREPYLDLLPSTHEMDANMHYAAFSPLPTRVGDAFYRNEKDHALIFLSYPDHQRTEDILNYDLQILSQTLHSVENLRSVSFVCDSLNDVPLIQQIADALQQALGIPPSIWGLRKGEFHDMFSIMAKSSVVFFGGNSLFADAIIRGIPAFPWRNPQSGADNIADAYRAYTENYDRDALLKSQRKQLDLLFEAQYLDATIPNHRNCFDHVLSDLINHAVHGQPFELKTAGSSQPEWVIAPAVMTESRTMPDIVRRSVWSDRQKLLQFKQPQNREIIRSNDRNDRQVFTRVK